MGQPRSPTTPLTEHTMAKRGAIKSGKHGSNVYLDNEGQPSFDLEPGHISYVNKMTKRSQGKGDGRRPEDKDAIARNWELAFPKKKK